MPDTEITRQRVTPFHTARQANDCAAAATLFADDEAVAWQQAGERSRGGANVVWV